MDPKQLRSFTTPKRFESTVEYGGSTFEIEVETPDLSGCNPSVWGDWGPMYTFEFDEPRVVRITHRCEALSIEEETELLVSQIQLDSPLLYERRREHPLFIRFRDPSRRLEFEGYLDVRGEPAALEVKRLPGGADVASLLLWQPPRTQSWQGAAHRQAM